MSISVTADVFMSELGEVTGQVLQKLQLSDAGESCAKDCRVFAPRTNSTSFLELD